MHFGVFNFINEGSNDNNDITMKKEILSIIHFIIMQQISSVSTVCL